MGKRTHARDPLTQAVKRVKRIAASLEHLLRKELSLPEVKGYTNPQPIPKQECLEFLREVLRNSTISTSTTERVRQ